LVKKYKKPGSANITADAAFKTLHRNKQCKKTKQAKQQTKQKTLKCIDSALPAHQKQRLEMNTNKMESTKILCIIVLSSTLRSSQLAKQSLIATYATCQGSRSLTLVIIH